MNLIWCKYDDEQDSIASSLFSPKILHTWITLSKVVYNAQN
jgi:hypothetical protein